MTAASTDPHEGLNPVTVAAGRRWNALTDEQRDYAVGFLSGWAPEVLIAAADKAVETDQLIGAVDGIFAADTEIQSTAVPITDEQHYQHEALSTRANEAIHELSEVEAYFVLGWFCEESPQQVIDAAQRARTWSARRQCGSRRWEAQQ
ncbi:hypothetical protein ACIRRA_13505 [Nocardia sp. NPDC101769]|uniref:hypothetical protein n=1 Tax=Nocardia sp. NPDC101769 TaxID=3364333 RepID=UPI0037F5D2AE